MLFGPAAGATIVALDGLIISVWLGERRLEFYRVAIQHGSASDVDLVRRERLLRVPRYQAAGIHTPNEHADAVHLLPLLCLHAVHFS